MKKQLAIIELETHSHLLEKWYLLLVNLSEFDFCFYIHSKVKNKIQTIPEHKLVTISTIQEVPLEKFNLIIVNTYHRYFESYLSVFKNTNNVVILHNLNFSIFFKIASVSNLIKNRQSLLYFMKLYFKERVLITRKNLLKAKNVAVLSNSLLSNLKNKEHFPIPFFLDLNYCEGVHFIKNKEIQIVIPGNVSSKRKDIDMVFNVLPRLKPVSKLHFTFLGKPENETILKGLQKIESKNNSDVKITYFEEYVPREIYDKSIKNAHVLFCPIKVKTSFYGITEIYGQTKASGNEGDCIYYGKIGLFPNSYSKFDWEVHNYSNESELINYFNKLTFESLKTAYDEISVLADSYSYDSIQNKLKNQLLEMIQN